MQDQRRSAAWLSQVSDQSNPIKKSSRNAPSPRLSCGRVGSKISAMRWCLITQRVLKVQARQESPMIITRITAPNVLCMSGRRTEAQIEICQESLSEMGEIVKAPPTYCGSSTFLFCPKYESFRSNTYDDSTPCHSTLSC